MQGFLLPILVPRFSFGVLPTLACFLQVQYLITSAVFLKHVVMSGLSLMFIIIFLFGPFSVCVYACSKYYSKRVFKCVCPSHDVPTFTLSCTKKDRKKKRCPVDMSYKMREK